MLTGVSRVNAADIRVCFNVKTRQLLPEFHNVLRLRRLLKTCPTNAMFYSRRRRIQQSTQKNTEINQNNFKHRSTDSFRSCALYDSLWCYILQGSEKPGYF